MSLPHTFRIGRAAGGTVYPAGEAIFETAGQFTFEIPGGVTSVSMVAVGGGGYQNYTSGQGNRGGGGGGLSYRNGYPVSPGDLLYVHVGTGREQPGSPGTPEGPFNSCIGTTSGGAQILQANGGVGGQNGCAGGSGGPSFPTADGGGDGGNGGFCTGSGGSGGGGGGGYSGAGGNGGLGASNTAGSSSSGQSGAGGGGGGGGGSNAGEGGCGGDVFLYGEGNSGAGAGLQAAGGLGSTTLTSGGTRGPVRGGGGAQGSRSGSRSGAIGAVRIIWSDAVTRSFPTTNVDQAASDGVIFNQGVEPP